jgi:hypothetical protein
MYHNRLLDVPVLLSRTHMQGAKQSVCPSVVVVFRTRMAQSRDVGPWVTCIKWRSNCQTRQKLARFNLA